MQATFSRNVVSVDRSATFFADDYGMPKKTLPSGRGRPPSVNPVQRWLGQQSSDAANRQLAADIDPNDYWDKNPVEIQSNGKTVSGHLETRQKHKPK